MIALESHINLTRGFLPIHDPLKILPKPFAAWEEVLALLPKILMTDQFKSYVQDLPIFPVEKLETDLEYERAMLLLSFLANAYVWEGDKPTPFIPAVIAVPFVYVAAKLHRPPILAYASYTLHNWFRLNVSRKIEMGNVALLHHFFGGSDEEWFGIIHICIENAAAPLLRLLPQVHLSFHHHNQLAQKLTIIATVLKEMICILKCMIDRCDPYIYHHRIRKFIYGWKNHPDLISGVIYENCFHNQPQFFAGATGAQSSIIAALDIFLNIKHEQHALTIYLQEMQTFAPRHHQLFLHELKMLPSVREYIIQSKDKNLVDAYNECVEQLVGFRKEHIKLAAFYIQKQTNDNGIGTGGTAFMTFLKRNKQLAELNKIF